MATIKDEDPLSPDDYDDSLDNDEDEGGHKKRKQVKRACFACRKAHARCDEERPCRRCIRTGCEATCVDVPRKKRVLSKRPEEMAKKSPTAKRGRPRSRKLDESGEGSESGGESEGKNFYFDAAEDEVLEGGSIGTGGKTTPALAQLSTGNGSVLPKKFDFSLSTTSSLSSSSSSSTSSSRTSNDVSDSLKLSWKDSLLDSMAFAHTDDDSKDGSTDTIKRHREDNEHEFCFDLGKSSDDERCLEEIPQEMVKELTELRSYNSTLQDMIKDVQQFNSYQRKKRRQWELSKINSGNGSSTATAISASSAAAISSTTAAPSDALPQWLVSDFSSLSNKMIDLSTDIQSSSSSASSSSSSLTHRSEEGEMDYIGAWQAAQQAAAPLHLPPQLAQLSSQQHPNGQNSSPSSQQGVAPQTGPAPFTTSLPFTEV